MDRSTRSVCGGLAVGALAAVCALTPGVPGLAQSAAERERPMAAAPPYSPVPPEERLVGIAYSNWAPPPDDPRHEGFWNNTWGTPLLGRYGAYDRAVIRQHAEWLAEAGVDFVWLDWSNNVDYTPGQPEGGGLQGVIERGTDVLFEEFAQLPRCPKISIFLGVTGAPEAAADGRLQRKADQIYDSYVADPVYGRLIQEYLGKPLLVVYVNTPSPWQHGTPEWDDERFTVRWMTGYITEQTNLRTDDLVSKYGFWSWEDRGDQTYPVYDGRPESMVVVASWRRQAEPGQPGYIAEAGRRDGATFRERWARAREIGPKFAMVVSWNEWTLGEQPSAEVSKDIEPSLEHGTRYLELLAEEIARFKGNTD